MLLSYLTDQPLSFSQTALRLDIKASTTFVHIFSRSFPNYCSQNCSHPTTTKPIRQVVAFFRIESVAFFSYVPDRVFCHKHKSRPNFHSSPTSLVFVMFMRFFTAVVEESIGNQLWHHLATFFASAYPCDNRPSNLSCPSHEACCLLFFRARRMCRHQVFTEFAIVFPLAYHSCS